jgi:putative hydrolase of the HAD superfamily
VIPESPVDPQTLIALLRHRAYPLSPIPTDRQARLIRLPDIRAVLFDLYGTLFVSASGDIASSEAEVRGRAMAEALEAVGLPVDRNTAEQAALVLAEAIARAHDRLRERGVEYPEVDIRSIMAEVLEYLRLQGCGVAEPTRALCETLAAEYECRSNPTWPMPGIVDMLRLLRKGEIQLGIVSNAQVFTPLLFPALLDRSLEILGFDPALCVWSYLLLEAKPSLKLFRNALQELALRGIEPGEVLYVGNDRVNDIWPAALVGMKTALFAGDSRSFRPRTGDPRISEVREDLLLTDLRQLTDVLKLR